MIMKSPTDWRNSDALDDDELFDVPSLSPSFFQNDKACQPQPLAAVTLQVEPDVVAWFKGQGVGWEKRMVAALRLYMEAHNGESQRE
jgi:uncharacterized protein (DUF4415 family)